MSEACEERKSQVAEQMDFLEKELARASELQLQVIGRFADVVRNEPKCDTGEDVKAMQELVPLANELRVFVSKLQWMSGGYEDMLMNAEL